MAAWHLEFEPDTFRAGKLDFELDHAHFSAIEPNCPMSASLLIRPRSPKSCT